MANEEQVERLKQGTEEWNKWRDANPLIKITLDGADLKGVFLIRVNLSGANLKNANLEFSNLSLADLSQAFLSGANLEEAYLGSAILHRAELCAAHLMSADLNFAKLDGADLRRAYLYGANLDGASLLNANLSGANLHRTNFKRITLLDTGLGKIDLSETEGLDDVIHEGPSNLSTSTLLLSKGKISKKFLKGCGLNDWEIELAKLYQPGISANEVNNIVYRIFDLRATNAIQISPLFISYSHKDSAFVDEMEKHLNKKGIRFWRDIHDATAGPLEKIVDRAMRLNPTVLLVLSEQSVGSDWVEHEAESARELEKELGRHVLCPVALDEAWKDCDWEMRLRRQIMKYNILDFSKWNDEGEFEGMLKKLIDGLDLFYKEG